MKRLPLAIPVIVLLILASVAAFMPDAPSKNYYENIGRPLLIAHQGGDGV